MGAYSNLADLSTAQVISGAAFSEFYIDMAVTVPKLGVGQHAPYLCIRTAVAPTQTGDSISIELLCAASISGTNLLTPKSVGMVLAGVTGGVGGVNEIAATDSRVATAGAWIYQGQLPYGVDRRYLQLYYNRSVSSGNFTIDAWLNDGPASTFRGSQVIKSNVGNP